MIRITPKAVHTVAVCTLLVMFYLGIGNWELPDARFVIGYAERCLVIESQREQLISR